MTETATTRSRKAAVRDEVEAPAPVRPAEEHLVSDLLHHSRGLLNVTSETFAGAIALSRWEMTTTVTIDQALAAVATFQSTPA